MRCSLRAAESPRRAVGSKTWYLSAPCLPISSASPKRTRSIGRRFTRTTTFRHSRWHGCAFSSACCGASLCPTPDPNLAALWYRRAIAYLPGYVKARVHLAEIYASQDQTGDAEALLLPALSSRDPEVRWRLADVLIAQGRPEEAGAQLDAARLGFDDFLERHLLAFADHAAEFYAGSGDDCRRALELARANVANRPTPRAVKQARAIAVLVGEAA